MPTHHYPHDSHKAEDITHRFNVHGNLDAPTLHFMAMMRRQYAGMAKELSTRIPPCRELAIAITKLEEAMFWTNSACARTYGNPTGFGDPPIPEKVPEADKTEPAPDAEETKGDDDAAG